MKFKKTFQLLIFLISFINYSFAQDIIPQLYEVDVPDGKITRTEYFDGNSLWGYINGGADVFLEYGLHKMLVQEILWKQHRFKIEIYQMKNDTSAFGIFSISHRRCIQWGVLTKFNCITPHQILIAHGKLFISIVHDNNSEEEQKLAIEIAQKILYKTEKTTFQLPLLFNDTLFLTDLNQIKFIKGKLGIQNGFPEWENLFEKINNFQFFILQIAKEETKSIVALIQFSDVNEKSKFYKELNITLEKEKSVWKNNSNETLKFIRELNSTTLYYLESNLPQKKVSALLDIINR